LPILFSGTLRSNVDPLGSFSDSEISIALQKCHFYDTLKVVGEQKKERESVCV